MIEGVAVKSSSTIVNAIQKHTKKWDFFGLQCLDMVSFNVIAYIEFMLLVYFLFPSVSVAHP